MELGSYTVNRQSILIDLIQQTECSYAVNNKQTECIFGWVEQRLVFGISVYFFYNCREKTNKKGGNEQKKRDGFGWKTNAKERSFLNIGMRRLQSSESWGCFVFPFLSMIKKKGKWWEKLGIWSFQWGSLQTRKKRKS